MNTVHYTKPMEITIDTLEYELLLRQKIEYEILIKTILMNSNYDHGKLSLTYTCDSAVEKLFELFKSGEFNKWKEDQEKEKEE